MSANLRPLPAPGTVARFVVDVLDGAARAVAWCDIVEPIRPSTPGTMPARRFLRWLNKCDAWLGEERGDIS